MVKMMTHEERITEKMALCLAYDYLRKQVTEQDNAGVYVLSPLSGSKITLNDSMEAIKNCISFTSA